MIKFSNNAFFCFNIFCRFV